jgi:hypothetical protein
MRQYAAVPGGAAIVEIEHYAAPGCEQAMEHVLPMVAPPAAVEVMEIPPPWTKITAAPSSQAARSEKDRYYGV